MRSHFFHQYLSPSADITAHRSISLLQFETSQGQKMKVERCLLASYPTGQLAAENFRFDDSTKKQIDVNNSLQDGQVLIKLLYISVDPYMRGRFKPGTGYFVPGFQIDQPIESFCVAEIVESKHDNFTKASLVTGMLPWETYQVVTDPNVLRGLQPIPANLLANGVPPSYFLGVLGTTGLSAYLPFQKLAQDFLSNTKQDGKDPVVFVSGAAGAVGSVFGQLCKSSSCTVYGSAGSDEKVELCKSKFGFDNAFNYRNVL
jgi:NADPH:quinone reductase